jgi:HAD superfamily phosphoserine phosphatase-like hydrolase
MNIGTLLMLFPELHFEESIGVDLSSLQNGKMSKVLYRAKSENIAQKKTKLRLAVFDLDGTLKAVRSPFRYVSESLGLQAQAESIFVRFQRGEIAYQDWGKLEVALWQGTPEWRLIQILHTIPYRPGAVEFVRRLKSGGVIIVLISAAFRQHVEPSAEELAAEFVCNSIGVADGLLTGDFSSRIDGRNKGSQDETLTAGDTAGDISMFSESAISIAVDPESLEIVQAASLLLPENDWRQAWELIDALRPGWLPPG